MSADPRVAEHGGTMHKVACEAIRAGLEGRRGAVELEVYALPLRQPGASFVTLECKGELRGCIGTIFPRRALIADVADNAYGAAFHDPRFPRVQSHEWAGLSIGISIMGPLAPIAADSESALLESLQPGIDGLVIEDSGRKAVFLPQVWEDLPEAGDFLAALKAKAGLSSGHWSASFRASRFHVLKIPAAPVG